MDHLSALAMLFELTDVASRLELKRDIMQDLEHARIHFSKFRDIPDIATEALEKVLEQINFVYCSLQSLSGPLGQHIRNNEWLMSIRKRNALPGGVCEFDLPSFHYWVNQDSEIRKKDLNEWFSPFLQLHEAVSLLLKLTRESAPPASCIATQGFFHQNQTMHKAARMLRIYVEKKVPYMPEVMASKHVLQVRFIEPDFQTLHNRTRQATEDVPFSLSICSF